MRSALIYPYYYSGGSEAFYVRPAGSNYGTGDGTSYENAWAGDADIDWASIPSGATLYVAGAWTETLNIDNSNVTIQNYGADPVTIDGADAINSGVVVVNKSNVTITGITVTNVLVNGFYFEGSTGIVTNNCSASNSSNQGFQHIGATTATHNNPTCTDNTDDGISVHDSGVITVNGGTFDGNAENINIIATAQVTINGSPTFTGTSTYDLYVTNATSANSSTITMNGGTVRNISADIGGRIILNDVTVSGTTSLSVGAGAGSIIATRSIFTGTFTVSTDGIAVLTNCYAEVFGTIGGSITFSKCYVKDDLALGATGTVIAEYSIFDGTGTAAALIDVNSGALGQIKYCVFKNMAANQFGVSFRTGALASSYCNNCTFIGTADVGRGLFSQIDLTSSNNIYYDLAIGYFRSAGTSILNNNCFFGNAAATSGTVTNNNAVNGDPLLVDVANNDFTLGVLSPCKAAGADLGSTFLAGIDTAVWGDANTVPVVTTKNQDALWDIGAYTD